MSDNLGQIVGTAGGAYLGSMVGNPIAGASLGSALGAGIDGNNNSGQILPDIINTGRSNYNRLTGNVSLDPRVRRMQDSFDASIAEFKTDTDSAYDTFDTGLKAIGDDFGLLRKNFEGNQSAYREAALNPIREAIATRKGSLDRELGRTKVRGSFANAERTNLAMDSGRTLADAEAKIENERINRLGDFINIDADILKQGLASETGRISTLKALEDSLNSLSMDVFNQEMSLLGLPAQFQQGGAAIAGIQANSQGVINQMALQGIGGLMQSWGESSGGGSDVYNATYDEDDYGGD